MCPKYKQLISSLPLAVILVTHEKQKIHFRLFSYCMYKAKYLCNIDTLFWQQIHNVKQFKRVL